ncbi:hypothetical protein L1987_38734 [Smallanthus sonchifolius]|uniref:Uncharacterized protein n=1 Tax=Smallanthus sonchifolius TaxID=185202 RepID=A0ACB9HKS6_9ASTR|nr:hypothetical protein L1987_38734 [Smallanthus sonchifolius]
MVSSASFGPPWHTCFSTPPSTGTGTARQPSNIVVHSPPLIYQKRSWFDKSLLPLAASMTLILSSYPEENQKRYAENDARFRESPLLKELLERSKLNKEKNRQAIQDKYCVRGAEWGVGDCSTEGMAPQERDEFIMALKKKAGIE